MEFRQKMAKTSSDDSSDVNSGLWSGWYQRNDKYITQRGKLLQTNVQMGFFVECWNRPNFSESMWAQLLKELENILAALDDEWVIMECLTTIEVKLKTADVDKKLKKSSVTTPPNPSKKRKTTDVQLPICKSQGVAHTMRNIIKFVSLFEAETMRLNQKNEYGSADVSKIYQLEKDARLSKDLLLKARENLKNIINTMKAKEISSLATDEISFAFMNLSNH